MRRTNRWLFAITLAAGAVAATGAFAQPTDKDDKPRRERRKGPAPDVGDDPNGPPGPRRKAPGDGPKEAPPAAQAETPKERAGFVWVPGRYAWRGKWEWSGGHLERERAGKKFRAGHWDRQGDVYVFTAGDWIDSGDARPATDYPKEAPPAPQEDKKEVRPGFVWIAGRWDWRGGKWEWVRGHREKERPGKRYNPGRWDKQGDHYAFVEGAWSDEAGPPVDPTKPPDQNPDRPRRKAWKLDRPVVSSYWPLKGKAGTRVVIHGKNFGPETSVLWSGAAVAGAKVDPDRIVVVVPAGAASGTLALHPGKGRDLIVGNFEVADFDATAETKRLDDEARKKSEQAWAERQKLLGKDHAARVAAAEKRHQELVSSREQRRTDRLKEIRAKWNAAFLADLQTQAELGMHAERRAELGRMREVAELSDNGKLVVRIGIAESREDQRHEARMTALHDQFQGGKP